MRTRPTGSRPWRRSVATAALFVSSLLVAACTGTATVTPSPSPSPTSTVSAAPSAVMTMAPPSASATATGGSALAPCAADALAVSGGPWSAAAGSRGADVVVENQGDAACTLSTTPHVMVVDSASQRIAETEPEPGAGPTLHAGGAIGFVVLFGNWCDPNAALPLHVVLQAADAGIQIQGLDLGQADLPPCNGPGQPPSLTANPWTAG